MLFTIYLQPLLVQHYLRVVPLSFTHSPDRM